LGPKGNSEGQGQGQRREGNAVARVEIEYVLDARRYYSATESAAAAAAAAAEVGTAVGGGRTEGKQYGVVPVRIAQRRAQVDVAVEG